MSKKALHRLLYSAKLKTILYSMMLFMGLIFLAVQLYMVAHYSSFIDESNAGLKSNAVKTLVRERLVHHHYPETLKAAEKIVSDPLFRNLFITGDRQTIKRQLDRAVSKTAILMSDLDMIEIRVLSIDYELLGIWLSDANKSISMKKIMEQLQRLPDGGSLEISSSFFKSDDGNPVHMLVFPVGATKIEGFLLFITSPLASLAGMGEFINAEVEVYNLAGQMIIAGNSMLRNPDVVPPFNPQDYTTMEIPISIDGGEPFLNVVVHYDNGADLDQKGRLKAFGVLATIIGFLVSLYIVSHVLNISMFSRIREISEALTKIMQGKTDIKLPKARNDELSVLWEQLEKIAAHEEDRNRLSYELVFALKEAEVSNLAKYEFLTNMSHELRTPLNAIIGFSEIMTCDYLAIDINDKYREYAHDIRDSGIHLLNIINDILDLSRIESGNMILMTEEVVLSDIIGKSVKTLDGPAREKSISIENRIPEKLPLLYLDERMVHQVLVNILSNAVKFTPEGGNIVINAGLEEDGTFCITISDNGIGIAEDQIENVISPFCQANAGYTKEQEGTGLGLALTKAFMELHGGRMYLESTWGVGTSVYLIFPGDCLSQETRQQDNVRESNLLLASQAN